MINFLKSLFIKRYGFPQFEKNVWYNFRAYDNKQFPVIFDETGKYIPCEIGNTVQMGVTDCGKKVFYKITKTHRIPGGDWLCPSDAIKCDMIFSHVSE